ncbi:MAG TPA: hypothetical protein VMT83_16500 [Burkholderiaceae bacterium]|nr:hypothetical protein [Burkholderiaceae bacterium]
MLWLTLSAPPESPVGVRAVAVQVRQVHVPPAVVVTVAPGLITFSGPRWEWPLPAGAQDRLSWLVQLVAIASATPDALRDGAKLSMWVVGTRGALSAWHFEVRGRQPDGAASAWWLVREPEHPYDLRVEVWLDPARGHWPLRLRQTQVPGGEPLEWLLREEPQPAREPDGARPT